MYQQQGQSIMPEKDMAYTVLADLKRVVREYATAATESSCPDIRQMFNSLTHSTLQLQGQLYQAMQSQQMYDTASPALKQEITKQMNQYQKTQQETQQFLSQRLGQQGGQAHPMHQGQVMPPAYQQQQQPLHQTPTPNYYM
ncbi:spore coat protein [Paenibacillus sp. GCM10023252]|uniref:spore coat protein n=1 Tax=Paenibacillus sp. GCM10023252 TaxID=3252649 RepID=UPI00360803BB